MDTKTIGGKPYVGQTKAVRMLDIWNKRSAFPHFLIVAGERGSGRKTFATLFAQEIDAHVSILPDISVDSIRRLVELSYGIDKRMVYVIPDADRMSAAASNSLLKLTEEPPENAYIVMTLLSLENTLGTLISRSQQIVLDGYDNTELSQLTSNPLISQLATTPGMLYELQLKEEGYAKELADFCVKLVNHIDSVTIVNALKSATKLKMKEADTKGFELNMFFAGIRYALNVALETYMAGDVGSSSINLDRLSVWYQMLSKHHYAFNRLGANKRAVFDQFIFDIRQQLKARCSV